MESFKLGMLTLLYLVFQTDYVTVRRQKEQDQLSIQMEVAIFVVELKLEDSNEEALLQIQLK